MRLDARLLAGLLMMDEGKAPGRPPGVEPRSSLAGGPQRANRQLYATLVLKEIAMKTFIIATILTVGVSLRPQAPPTAGNVEPTLKSVDLVSVAATQESPRQLVDHQMKEMIGSGLLDCQWLIEDGRVYGRCCIGLWIFRICGYIDVGPLPAAPLQ